MNNVVGDILFPLLVIEHLLWDWTHGSFRGIIPQIVGALMLGTVVDVIVNASNSNIGKTISQLIVFGLLCLVFYWWAVNTGL